MAIPPWVGLYVAIVTGSVWTHVMMLIGEGWTTKQAVEDVQEKTSGQEIGTIDTIDRGPCLRSLGTSYIDWALLSRLLSQEVDII
jgi:hypothetical protein